MTEASPVTHVGYLEPELYKPESIGQPLAQTECRVVNADGHRRSENEVAPGQPGELVMRGPQFMMGYWRDPQATAAVLRDGWFWSGDIVTRDADDFYYVVDRRKEMIKYKGFPVAPAEVEALLLEHPAVRDCGVVGRADPAAGEIPVAFIVLREGSVASKKIGRRSLRIRSRASHHLQAAAANPFCRRAAENALRQDPAPRVAQDLFRLSTPRWRTGVPARPARQATRPIDLPICEELFPLSSRISD